MQNLNMALNVCTIAPAYFRELCSSFSTTVSFYSVQLIFSAYLTHVQITGSQISTRVTHPVVLGRHYIVISYTFIYITHVGKHTHMRTYMLTYMHYMYACIRSHTRTHIYSLSLLNHRINSSLLSHLVYVKFEKSFFSFDLVLWHSHLFLSVLDV